MDWKTVSNAKWKYTGYNYRGDLYLRLEYNDTTATPTSVSVRFVMYRADEGIKYSDGFGVLLNPVNSDGSMNSEIKFLKLKDATAGDFSTPWPADDYASKSFILEKKYSEASFTLPPFWFINTWAQNTAVQSAALDGDVSRIFNYAKDGTGAARNYKTKFEASSWSIASSSTVAGNVTAYAPKITNHGNSTFTIQVSAGGKGTNNEVSSTTLYYRIGGSGNYTKASGLTIEKKALTCGTSAKSQIIYAYSVVVGVYGDSITSSTTSLEVPNYVIPNAPGKPVLTDSSFKNGRLTVKQPWTYTWSAPTKTNDSSLVKGYRIRLYNSRSGYVLGIKSDTSDPNKIVPGTGEDNYLDRETASCTVTFDPVECGFKPGDYVSLGIYAYTRNGNSSQLFNGNGDGSAHVRSDGTLVQNAGVLHFKTDDGWVEGQVYVKTEDGWQEAETVNIKTEDGWAESQ